MTMNNNKVVLLTGAAQGIGAAYARHLYGKGYALVLADIRADGLQEVVESFTDRDRVLAIPTDVSDPTSCEALAQTVRERHGRLDGLVNNAAIFSSLQSRCFWEIPRDEWEQVMAVNVTGPWLLTTAVLPLLRAAATPSIVNIGSDTAAVGRPGYMHYVVSKGAVQTMTYVMARELGEFGIRVNTLSPAYVDTGAANPRVDEAGKRALVSQQALQRVGAPEDMASVLEFLLSNASGYVTGQTLSVNGGWYHR